jgi:hypothetical protein
MAGMSSAYAQEAILLNIMEDAWAVLRMTGFQVIREDEQGRHNLVIELMDEHHLSVFYTLDNGHNASPDGRGLRVHYQGLTGPEIFSRYNLPGDTLSWQQKAVEPALVAIQQHRSELLKGTTDNE